MKKKNTSVLMVLTRIDTAMNEDGWDCIVQNPAGYCAQFKVCFQEEFRRFINTWTDKSVQFCQQHNVPNSPITIELEGLV